MHNDMSNVHSVQLVDNTTWVVVLPSGVCAPDVCGRWNRLASSSAALSADHDPARV